jgi:hypothetical protein
MDAQPGDPSRRQAGDGMSGRYACCMDLMRDSEGKLVILPSGERLCCHRGAGHRGLHADLDDDGQEVEW